MKTRIKGNLFHHKGVDFRISTKYSQVQDAYENQVIRTDVRLIELVRGADDSMVSGGVVLKGTAICSIKDQFDRKLGRTIAIGRALKELVK